MPVVKLNARNIRTLPAVAGVRTDYRDHLLPGFFLRVTARGTRSFGIVYAASVSSTRRATADCGAARSGLSGRSVCRKRERRRRGSAAPSLRVRTRKQTGLTPVGSC
jgi:hypothetical protein